MRSRCRAGSPDCWSGACMTSLTMRSVATLCPAPRPGFYRIPAGGQAMISARLREERH